MMKYFYQKYRPRFAALFLAAFCILALAGCSNMFSPAQQESGLMITVSADVNPRTLYPDTSFTKYVLGFSGSATHEDITLQDGQTSAAVSDLAAGEWTITVVGYVTIDGIEYPAAQGSEQITIVSGSFQTITIPISASQTGDDGFFSYNVSYPETLADTAQLWVFPFGTSQWSVTPVDLSQNPADTIPLAPGYYMMAIRLFNDNHTAGRAEVVHIYANMETKAEYTFVENDFAKTITLSGTVAITVDGEPLDENRDVTVTAYYDADYSDYAFNTWVNRWEGYAWSREIAPFDTDTPLYFTVRFGTAFGEVEKRIGVCATAKDQNIANINLAYNQAVITLSGTVNVTVNGTAPQGNVYVWAYRNVDYSGSIAASATVNLQDTTWSMRMLPFETDTPLYFAVSFVTGNSGHVIKGSSVSIVVNDESRNDINLDSLDLSALILSGTVDITIDGEPLDEHRFVTVTAYRDADYSDYVFDAWVSLWQGNAWSIVRDPFETNTPLYFSVRFDSDWGYFEERTGVTVIAKDQNIDNIDLAYNLPLLTLSGTVNATVNGTTPPSSVWVGAYRDENYSDSVGSVWIDLQNNTWSIRRLPFETDTPLYFAVGFNGFRKDTGITVTAKDQNINNINLGAVNFNVITLSGTAEITVNGETADHLYLRVYRDDDYIRGTQVDWNDNTWSILFEPFDTDTLLSFTVEYHIYNNNIFGVKETGVSVTAKDQDITGIAIVCDFTD